MDFASFQSSSEAMDIPEADRALFTMLDAEGQRYAGFFATLEQTGPSLISKYQAVEFFAKSSLSDAEVHALYNAIKSVHVTSDPSMMNEIEFTMGMHLIVCLTKRGLSALPSKFPLYLFPSLPLPLATTATTAATMSHAHSLISEMPSPEKPLSVARTSFSSSAMEHHSASLPAGAPPPPSGEIAKLCDTTSLTELVQKELQNTRLVDAQLTQLDQSNEKALYNLQSALSCLAVGVAQLGFVVPDSSHASIGSLDEFGNLLRQNVQSLKQEIQSLEISAQMRSVADEVNERTGSGAQATASGSSSSSSSSDTVMIAQVASLTQQLAALQHESAQLREKKDALARRVLERKPMVSNSNSDPLKAEEDQAAQAMASMSISMTTGKSAGSSAPATSATPPISSSSSLGGLAASSSWGDFGDAPASVAPAHSTVFQSVETPSSLVAGSSDAFGMASSAAIGTSSGEPAQKDDFGWGAFQ